MPRLATPIGAGLLMSAAALMAARVDVTVGIDPSQLAGADPQGRVLIHTPDPLEPGSSVSHWDPSASPNLLMEPVINTDLPFNQADLTLPLLRDEGWPAGSSTITLRVQDPAGQGFNDPVRGAERLAAAQFAANFWAARLGSGVEINVEIGFQSLECGAGGGVLAQAGANFLFEDFAGAPAAGTWYHGPLAEALSGDNLSLEDDGNPNAGDLGLTFNSQIDQACLGAGSGFHYGLNSNVPPGQISFVAVALHEMAHGLGFASFASSATGSLFLDDPDIYLRFLFDRDRGLHWHQMNDAQRRASARNTGKVAWSGSRVTAQADDELGPRPSLIVHSPANAAGSLTVGLAAFGPPLTVAGVRGDLVIARDASANPTLLCQPATNGGELTGNVALIDRGTCNFTVKVRNAQNAGAVAAVIVNNEAGGALTLGGTDVTVVIPAVSVSQDDGELLKAALMQADEPGRLRFTADSFSAPEGAGSAVVTVSRVGGTAGAVGVSYAASAGSATPGVDFQTVSGTLSFAAGEGGSRTFEVPILDDGDPEPDETVDLVLSSPSGGATLGSPATATLLIVDDECAGGDTVTCLAEDRFKVTLRWRDFTDSEGDGHSVATGTKDSGIFYFFDDPDNWEMLFKVIDGCAFNGRYWVFAAATTNVEYTLRVTDTLAGVSKEYFNPLGVASPAITDTSAFATCP